MDNQEKNDEELFLEKLKSEVKIENRFKSSEIFKQSSKSKETVKEKTTVLPVKNESEKLSKEDIKWAEQLEQRIIQNNYRPTSDEAKRFENIMKLLD